MPQSWHVLDDRRLVRGRPSLSAPPSMSLESLLKPLGYDGWDHFGVDQQRLGAIARQPFGYGRQVGRASHRNALQSARMRDGSKVRVRKLHETYRLTETCEMVDFGSIGSVVIHNDENAQAEPSPCLEVWHRHPQPSVAKRGHGHTVRSGDGVADCLRQYEADRLICLREDEPIVWRDRKVHRRPTHEVPGVDDESSIRRKGLLERDRKSPRIDPACRVSLLVGLLDPRAMPDALGQRARPPTRAAEASRLECRSQGMRGRH